MRHLAAFYSNATIAAPTLLAAVPDTQIFSQGTIQRVPPAMPNLCMAAAFYDDTSFLSAQVQTPSLRVLANYDVSPINATLPAPNTNSYDDRYDAPLELEGNESLTVELDAAAGGNKDGYLIVEYCDAPVKAVTEKSFTVKATGAATLSAGTFVNTAIALNSTLPDGTYNVVGFRAEGANLIAARIAFVGLVNRPGVLGITDPFQEDNLRYRQGASGVFGSFDTNQPPTVDCLGITDTTQVFYFDLIKTK